MPTLAGGADLGAVVTLLGLALARVAPVVWLAPFFGGRLVPATVRPAVSLALALVLLPRLWADAAAVEAAGAVTLLAVLGKEVLVGLALGFIVALVFHGAQAAGELVDLSRGASAARGPGVLGGGRQVAPLGDFFLLLALVLFIALGGHRLVIVALAGSYGVLPLVAFPETSGLAALAWLIIEVTAQLVALALALAAPVLASLLLTDLALGWVNRFAPQLNVYFLALPLKALLAVAVLLLGFGLLTAALPAALEGGVRQLERALALLAAVG